MRKQGVPGWQDGFRLAMTIAGTTIGAGFASGREIWEFFTVYGEAALQGIAVFVGLFIVCCWFMLRISWEAGKSDYADVMAQFLPPRMVTVYDGLLLVYLFSLTVVMFAASGAVFQSHGFSFTLGVLLLAGAVFVGLLYNVQGLLTLNSWLTPLMAGILLCISLSFLVGKGFEQEAFFHDQVQDQEQDPDLVAGPVNGLLARVSGATWPPHYGVWASAIVYTAFNLLPLIGVLSASAQSFSRRRDLLLGAGLGGFLLGLLLFVANGALLLLPPSVGETEEILLFQLAKGFPLRLDGLVSFVLWLAVFTTALSGMYSLAVRVSAVTHAPYLLVLSLLMIAVIPCSYFGFASLVKIIYPIYGMASLFFVGCLLISPLRGNNGADDFFPPARQGGPLAGGNPGESEQIGR